MWNAISKHAGNLSSEELPRTAQRRRSSAKVPQRATASTILEEALGEETIASIEQAQVAEQRTIESLKKELAAVKLAHSKAMHSNQILLKDLEREKHTRKEQLESLQSLKGQQPRQDGVEILLQQMAKVQSSHEKHVEQLRNDLIQAGEERIAMEADYAARLEKLIQDKQTSEQSFRKKLDLKQQQVTRLEETLQQIQNAARDNGLDTNTVESIVEMNALKSKVDLLAKERDEMEATHAEERNKDKQEIKRLQEANTTKQRLIEQLETSDALTALESESTLLPDRWNGRKTKN